MTRKGRRVKDKESTQNSHLLLHFQHQPAYIPTNTANMKEKKLTMIPRIKSARPG